MNRRGLIVDLFAGAGGASSGIEHALGRSPDVAINHSELAIACHARNHPKTRHYITDVWDVDPREATKGRPVDLLWASPDCRHFSRAKGGKPVSPRVRSLAWVVIKWAQAVAPRVICVENVAELLTWGPCTKAGERIKSREGETWRAWVRKLRRLGYDVEWRVLNAADYGAPTSRKRLFVVARRDGQAIVWPRPTHGPARPHAHRSAAECIDWSDLGRSIFGRSKPLAEATLRRIARGIVRFVLESPSPFIVLCNHAGDHFRGQPIDRPMSTICAAHDARGVVAPVLASLRGTAESHLRSSCDRVDAPAGTISAQGTHHAVAAANIVQTGYSERKGQAPRCLDATKPLGTIVGSGKHAVAATIIRNYGGMDGVDARRPLPTVTAVDHHSLAAAAIDGAPDRSADVAEFLRRYADYPAGDRVLVTIDGVECVLTDITLRMLQPAELQRAQGFPDSYRIEGTQRDRVRLIGNSVSPPVAAAVVRAQLVDAAPVVERQEALFA